MCGTLGPSVSSKHPLVSRSHVVAIGAALDTGTITSEIISAGAPVSPLRGGPRDRRARLSAIPARRDGLAADSRRDGLGSRRPGANCIGEKNAASPRHARSPADASTHPASTTKRPPTNHRLAQHWNHRKNRRPPARSANAPAPLDTQDSFREGVLNPGGKVSTPSSNVGV